MKPYELMSRWETRPQAVKDFLDATLKPGTQMTPTTFPELGVFDGRLDLRGIQVWATTGLTPGVTRPATFERPAPDVRTVKAITFDSIDFTGADLGNRSLEKCVFNNILFTRTSLKKCVMRNSQFKNCIFDRTDCNDSGIGFRQTNYENCRFIKINFSKTFVTTGEFDRCVFEDCRFNGLDCDGTSFEMCKFIGKVHSIWFRGMYPVKVKDYYEKNFGPSRQNRMLNVDFSEASLKDITFSDGCDLSTCILPKDDFIYRFSKMPELLQAVKARVPIVFTPQDGKVLEYVKVLDNHATYQFWDIINFKDYSKYLSMNVIERLRDLFVEEAKKIGALHM